METNNTAPVLRSTPTTNVNETFLSESHVEEYVGDLADYNNNEG